jgi:hypothetical protein
VSLAPGSFFPISLPSRRNIVMHSPNSHNGHPAQAVAYSLHYGNGSRSLAWVIPDNRWPGMWRIHWPDDRISDMANLTRTKDAAIAICERGPPRLRDSRLFQWREARIAPLVAPLGNSDPKAGKALKNKLTRTAQWMADHPNDEPCPTGYQAQRAAREWRKARGIILEPAARKQRAKYLAAMGRTP